VGFAQGFARGGDELDVLITLIDAKEHYPIDLPDLIEAIQV
jgi:hypothetical protein